jgi:hypothetical protein
VQPREWSPPPIEPSRGPAAAASEASAQSPRAQWGVLEYFVSFVIYMLFFGVIAGLLRSRFPIGLGMFLFFTNDGLIEWVLRKVGIRLVPDSLGATFVTAFVWVAGASILFAPWKDSAPAWMSSWLPRMFIGLSLLVRPSDVLCSRPSQRRSSGECCRGSGSRSLVTAWPGR